MKSKKINLDLVVMYYVQINLFLLIHFLGIVELVIIRLNEIITSLLKRRN